MSNFQPIFVYNFRSDIPIQETMKNLNRNWSVGLHRKVIQSGKLIYYAYVQRNKSRTEISCKLFDLKY